MKEKSVRIKENKAITLIALVVTIVVLIILAGISIGALTGDNGIITQTQNAKDQTEIADEKERIDLSTIGAVGKEPRGELKRDYFNDELTAHIGQEGKDYSLSESENAPFVVEYLDSKRSYLVDEDGNITGPLIAPEETEEPESGGTEFTMLYGVIEIKWLVGDTNFVSETANAPVIKTDIPNTTMKLVNYDKTGTPVYNTDYNYEENRWANTEVEIDYGNNQKIKSYFVWIPRYAYRIIYFDTPDNRDAYRNGEITEDEAIKDGKIIGYSDSRGIVSIDTGGNVKKVSGTTSLNIGGNYFRVHPAFIDDSKNNYENGGWDEELPGIWVGKYETASIDANTTSTGSETKLKVVQNVKRLLSKEIGSSFIIAKEYSVNLNSHMLKNSEWGAVVYLTESKYGKNGEEIEENKNQNYLTANGNFINNQNQSTTGNEMGIYDLSGFPECVPAYYNGALKNHLYPGDSFATRGGLSSKYSTAYTNTILSYAYKAGDATYETNGWHMDYSEFMIENDPFLSRGGKYDESNDKVGIFAFSSDHGNLRYGSFHLCLIIN